ncbi:hypothetical protein, partial [Staphylococcus nepalensis]|uniref:hypothetical protein n=1 Tax=Staphylococcus nepalensis TaxID=214473 RepID=UPI00285C20EB
YEMYDIPCWRTSDFRGIICQGIEEISLKRSSLPRAAVDLGSKKEAWQVHHFPELHNSNSRKSNYHRLGK